MLANDVGTIFVLLGYMSFVTQMSTLVVVQGALAKDVGTIVLLGYMSLVTQTPWPTTRDHHRADLPPPTYTKISNNNLNSEHPFGFLFRRSELRSLFVGVGSNPTDLITLLRDFGRVV